MIAWTVERMAPPTTKVAMSASTNPCNPMSGSSAPPSGEPASRATFALAWINALALVIRSAVTNEGTIACCAGAVMLVHAACTAATR